MHATYDPEADAAYVYLCDIEPGQAVTQHVVDLALPGAVVLDFDQGGRLLGVEILGARRIAPPAFLDQAAHP